MAEHVYTSGDAYRTASARYLKAGFAGGGICIQHRVDKFWAEFNETKEWVWAAYRLAQLPGCCGVAVSYNSAVDSELKGNGLGDYFHKERIDLCRDSGYSCMLATTTADNLTQINLFEKNGWTKVDEFVNRRTRNTVQIWTKHI